ncbi:MAG TPA: stalk domain-containing protein, partial [Longimicrobiaceae bacterium]|nr:stalk domain-containing protein [Longimicrobiaceae bacterium]
MSMRGLWLLAAAVVLPVPAGPLPGQGVGAWHVVNERGTVAVQPVAHGAYQALPLSTLVSVGAQVSYGRGTVDVQLGAATLHFRIGSAEVQADSAPIRLEGEVYEEGGVVFVPLGFFRTYLPRASAGLV